MVNIYCVIHWLYEAPIMICQVVFLRWKKAYYEHPQIFMYPKRDSEAF